VSFWQVVVLVGAPVYVWALIRRPYKKCRRCNGAGTDIYRRWHRASAGDDDCRRCGAEGRHLRWRWVHPVGTRGPRR
jgi:hypothetical protein